MDFKSALAEICNMMERKRLVDELIGLYQNGHFNEAKRKAVLVAIVYPNYDWIYNFLAVCFAHLGEEEKCIVVSKQTIAINPRYAEAFYNLGGALKDTSQFEKSIPFFRRALILTIRTPEIYNNLGLSYKNLGRLSDSLSAYNRALILDNNFADVYFNRASVHLTTGNYKKGFEDYEWRWKSSFFKKDQRHFKRPQWTGKDSIYNKRLLVHAEQGLGDTIQFCRYIPYIEQLGAKVLFSPQPALKKLMSTLPGSSVLVDFRKQNLEYDYHSPLISLPYCLKTTLESIPNELPYLSSNPLRRKYWQKEVGSLPLKVGICWKANDTKTNNGRSIPLSLFRDISVMPGITFISLVNGDHSKEIDNSEVKIVDFDRELDVGPDAFLDTIELISLCDLVISCDTAVAHLAGAVGTPTWILLKSIPDWRWGLVDKTTAWYPNATLFRQPANGNWSAVIKKIQIALAELTASNDFTSVP